jgi:hypothetical protein
MKDDEFQNKKHQFENELYSFFDRNEVTIKNNSNRLCHYFEMACYSKVIQYYRNRHFRIQPYPPGESTFRFKSTTKGSPNKYSFFRVSENIANPEQEIKEYDIRSNMPVCSSFDNCTYIPDIVVSEMSEDDNIQRIENQNLITFCEVKYLKPHPEMLANFIGIVHELKPDLLNGPNVREGLHPAPALMASGHSSENVHHISGEMKKRYTVNFALFYENNLARLVAEKRISESSD